MIDLLKATTLVSQIIEPTEIDEHLEEIAKKSNSRTHVLHYICCNK